MSRPPAMRLGTVGASSGKPSRHALEWTRTTTGETPHKALNLARLPIPPRARAWAVSIEGRGRCGSVRRRCTLVEHTFVLESALGARLPDGRPHEAPAGDLRVH